MNNHSVNERVLLTRLAFRYKGFADRIVCCIPLGLGWSDKIWNLKIYGQVTMNIISLGAPFLIV